jgi:hypothetical protein
MGSIAPSGSNFGPLLTPVRRGVNETAWVLLVSAIALVSEKVVAQTQPTLIDDYAKKIDTSHLVIEILPALRIVLWYIS